MAIRHAGAYAARALWTLRCRCLTLAFKPHPSGPVSGMSRRLSVSSGLWLLLWTSAVPAATVLSLDIEQQGERYRLQAVMLLEASPPAVMHVLQDYRHLPRLNPAIKSVRIVARSPSVTRVETRAKLCVLFFCETLHRVQDVRRVSDTQLRAKVIPRLSDFSYGVSQWTVTRVPRGTRLHYNTVVNPGEWLPPVIGSWLLRRAMKTQVHVTARNLEDLASAHGQ